MRKIELPRTTNQCDEAPRIEIRNSNIILTYEDSESEEIISIHFRYVYGYRYTEMEYIDVKCYDTFDYIPNFIEVENSDWKELLLNIWGSSGRNKNDAFGGEPSKTRHYRLYFDDYGMYDVLCKEISIEQNRCV